MKAWRWSPDRRLTDALDAGAWDVEPPSRPFALLSAESQASQREAIRRGLWLTRASVVLHRLPDGRLVRIRFIPQRRIRPPRG